MYSLINKSYMRLSREMEFHADAVAASVSGSNNCINALQKIEVCDACFSTVMNKANKYLRQNEVLENIYSNHNVVMKYYAREYDLPLKSDAPVITDGFLSRFQLSKINIVNQWASHPSIADRVERLAQLKVKAVEDDRSAWVLFNNSASLQQQLTSVVYNHLPPDQNEKTVTSNEFEKRYAAEAEQYRLPAEFNGYFDGRQMNDIDTGKVFSGTTAWPIGKSSLPVIFNDENVALPRKLAALQSDVELVQAIIDKSIEVKSFDFDGKKFKKSEAPVVLEKINSIINEIKDQAQKNDEAAAAFFYAAAVKKGPESADLLTAKYAAYFANRKKADAFVELCMKTNEILAPWIQGQTVTITAAKVMANDLQNVSGKIRIALKGFVESDIILDESDKNTIQHFIESKYKYFDSNAFLNWEIFNLQHTLEAGMNCLRAFQSGRFKDLLQYQLSLLD